MSIRPSTTAGRNKQRRVLWFGSCLVACCLSACVGPDLEPPGPSATRGTPFNPNATAPGAGQPTRGPETVGAATGGSAAAPPATMTNAPIVPTTPPQPANSAGNAAPVSDAPSATAGSGGGSAASEDAGVDDAGRDAGTLRR